MSDSDLSERILRKWWGDQWPNVPDRGGELGRAVDAAEAAREFFEIEVGGNVKDALGLLDGAARKLAP